MKQKGQRQWYEKHPEYNHQYYLRTRDRQLQYNRERKYGLTRDAFIQMLDAQDHKCPVCGALLTSSNDRATHVDHDHVTGKVRGILCGNCNLSLGQAKHDPDRLRRLADYLECDRS